MIYFDHPAIIFLIIPLIFLILYYIQPKSGGNILQVLVKLAVIFLILLSLASPYNISEKPGTSGSGEVNIIADNTASMRIFDPDVPEKVYDNLANRTRTNIDQISGSTSSIGEAIFRNIEPGNNILLISDGNNNHRRSIIQAVNFAKTVNSTVFYLIQEPVKKDMSVSIAGDDTAVEGTRYEFFTDTGVIGNIEGNIRIYIDEKIVDSIQIRQTGRIAQEYVFNTTGSHRIKAEISGTDDEIPENDVFYKSVYVVPEPRILVVSKKESPMSKLLGFSYDVNFSSDLIDPAPYEAVILDDVDPSELSEKDAVILSDYAVNGGGIVTFGGPDSFKTEGSMPIFEQMIPVKSGGTDVRSKRAAVVLVIDISGSTGDISGSSVKLGVEKGLANQAIDSLSADDFLGVIAFNNAPHTIISLSRNPDNSNIKDIISRLKYGGTTHISPALSAAFEMLKDFNGGKNVIVISDGAAADTEEAIITAGLMSDSGITINTIGVGWDTNEDFMKSLAAKTGGTYLKRDESGGIRLLLGKVTDPGKINGFPIMIIESSHFITDGVSLNATIYGYNKVYKKQNAQTLVMTSTGNPVISTWRFGLGRVVSISTDNGNTWAHELYDVDNSGIISSSVNYAIGDPRKSDRITAEDGEIGEPLRVSVLSDVEPQIIFEGKALQFDRTGENQYTAVITPDSAGFKDISGLSVAVNSPDEYREIGNNGVIPEIITASGGKVYRISQIDDLIPDIGKKSTSIVQERVELFPFFLFLALSLYSLEIIVRRILKSLR